MALIAKREPTVIATTDAGLSIADAGLSGASADLAGTSAFASIVAVVVTKFSFAAEIAGRSSGSFSAESD